MWQSGHSGVLKCAQDLRSEIFISGSSFITSQLTALSLSDLIYKMEMTLSLLLSAHEEAMQQ